MIWVGAILAAEAAALLLVLYGHFFTDWWSGPRPFNPQAGDLLVVSVNGVNSYKLSDGTTMTTAGSFEIRNGDRITFSNGIVQL